MKQLLAFVDKVIARLPDRVLDQFVDPRDQYFFIVRAIEDRDFAFPRCMRMGAPQEVVVEFLRGRWLEVGHPRGQWIQSAHDMPDRPVLAGAVHTLQMMSKLRAPSPTRLRCKAAIRLLYCSRSSCAFSSDSCMRLYSDRCRKAEPSGRARCEIIFRTPCAPPELSSVALHRWAALGFARCLRIEGDEIARGSRVLIPDSRGREKPAGANRTGFASCRSESQFPSR